MKIQQILTAYPARLDTSSPRLDTILLVGNAISKTKEWILANTEYRLSDEQFAEFTALFEQRKKHYPLAYLTGYKNFYGHDFTVAKGVLVPRPETEALVEHIVGNAPKNSKILDMGTGSGCIAIALKLERPDLEIVASDISTSALEVAQLNANRLGAEIKLIDSDLFANSELRATSYDVIAANLPYVPTSPRHKTNSEIAYEPPQALFSGEDGLGHYRNFLQQAASYLRPGGFTVIEHDPVQLKTLINEFPNLRFAPITDFITRL